MAYQGIIKKSRTLDFNIGAGIIAAGLAVEQYLPILQGSVSVETYQGLVAVMVIGNIIYRFKTKNPVGEK